MIPDSIKRALVCIPLWASCFLAAAQPKSIVSVDLLPKGLPADFTGYSFNCAYHYPGYYSLQWVDAERILVAFSTSPVCSILGGHVDGALRLLIFDVQGNALRSADVPYDAGDGAFYLEPDLRHDGIWIGPEQTVLVEFRGPSTDQSGARKILVLSSELSPQQRIGAYPSAHALLNTTDLSDKYWESGRTPLPRGYEMRDFVGNTIDGTRASLVGAKAQRVCQATGIFCPSLKMLIVFEVATEHVVFKMKLPIGDSARAALSTDGKHIAVVEHGRLEIFVLPN